MRRIEGIVAVLVITPLFGGCGATYKKRDFVARADAICVNAVRATRSITPPSIAPAGARRLHVLARYLARVLPIVQSEARQLRALRRPTESADDRALLERYLTVVAKTASSYGAMATAALKGDLQGVTVAEAALRVSPVATLARSYGLRSCGTPGATGV